MAYLTVRSERTIKCPDPTMRTTMTVDSLVTAVPARVKVRGADVWGAVVLDRGESYVIPCGVW
jgi:hypothetical protein